MEEAEEDTCENSLVLGKMTGLGHSQTPCVFFNISFYNSEHVKVPL